MTMCANPSHGLLRCSTLLVTKLLCVLVQAHAGLLLAELLHLPRQHFLLGGVEGIVPALLRAIPFAEIQFQFVAEAVFLDIVVGVDVEPVIILVGTHKCAECCVHIEVSLHIEVELAI